MLRDAAYLADILSAAADLLEFTRAASLEEFCSNKTLRYGGHRRKLDAWSRAS